MRFDVITLFPDIFQVLQHGVTRRAMDSGSMQLHCWNPRDFAQGAYRRVDDRPFGGGPGMVMLAEPLAACLQAIRAQRGEDRSQAPLIYFSPVGQPIKQSMVNEWAASSRGAVLLCGRYEGVDQRFIDLHVDWQISLGDFVLSGGEIPALAWLDAVARLQEGVLHDAQSHAQDSFSVAWDGLLDHPHYTRPEVWQGQAVPETLLSGHHGEIDQWRRAQRLRWTARHRPDLLEKARSAGLITASDEKILGSSDP